MTGFTYKSYNFVDKDPIIDMVRTIINNSDLSVEKISDASGVGRNTILRWLYGETKKPQAATLNAVLRTLGYKLDIVGSHYMSEIKPTPFNAPSNVYHLPKGKKRNVR